MSRVFWQLFGLASSCVVGGMAWLVAHKLDVSPESAGALGVLFFLVTVPAMHVLLAEKGKPTDAHKRDPWDDGRELLHREEIPQALHDMMRADDVTRVLSARDFVGYRGERRSLKPGGRS